MAVQQLSAGTSWIDRLILGITAVVLIAGVSVAAFAMPADKLGLRVLVLLAAVGVALAIAYFSSPGKRFVAFGQEAVAEVKKVTWPTRKETIQTTIAVFAFVIIMALVLWIVDKALETILYDFILGWKR